MHSMATAVVSNHVYQIHRAHHSRSAKFPGVLLADLIPWTRVCDHASLRLDLEDGSYDCSLRAQHLVHKNMLQPRQIGSHLTNHQR